MSEESKRPGLPEVDLHEYGGKKDGERQKLDERLFMQLLVFDSPPEVDPEEAAGALVDGCEKAKLPGVIYEDASSPFGLALLSWSKDPAHFVTNVRPIFRAPELRRLVPRIDYTMLGRTYSSGYEPDLPYWLLQRPIDNVTDPKAPWAIWYPLRRTGAFAALDRAEQASILREHAGIGMAYGKRDLAHDVRLACHGLYAKDNEFLIGLIGQKLHPLSHVVQAMRSTRQTAEYIAQMGPFFVGHARWQSKGA